MGTPKKLTTTQTKRDLDELLLKVQRQYTEKGKTVSPIICKKILKLAKSLNEEKVYGKVLLMLAWYYLIKRQFNTSLLYISECLILSKKLNAQDWLPKLYNWSGYIHKAKGDFSNAIDYYELEIEINAKLGLEKDNIVAYQVLGNIFDELENSKIAEAYFLKAKSIAEKYPNYREVINNIAQVNLSLIGIMCDSNRNTEAKKLAEETLEFVNIHKSIPRIIIPNIYEAISHIYYNNKDYKESIEYAVMAGSYPIKKHQLMNFCVSRIIAYNYDALEGNEDAFKFYKKSLNLIDKVQGEYNIKNEVVKKAIAFYEKHGYVKETQSAYSLLDKIEAEQQMLRSKLNLRTRTALSYENVNKDLSDSEILKIQTIHNGIVKVTRNAITACYTDNKVEKNVSRILIAERSNEISTRKSLKSLYDILNHENFVWIDRNAFINKTRVSDWEQVAQMGRVNISGKTFSISRSKRKELFNNYIKIQQIQHESQTT